jgi:hypothetical protein
MMDRRLSHGIKEKIHQKLTCICGVSFSKYNKARHEKSITHQSFIDAQQ